MTKIEMITRINAIVSEYVGGCDGMYGIKGHSVERLAARLEAYETMIAMMRNCRALESCFTQRQWMAQALMAGTDAEHPDHALAMAYWMEASQIWSQNF